MLNCLYLYSAFLILMTTQSTLQYRFDIQPHTYSYSASKCSTFLSYINHTMPAQLSEALWGSVSCPRTLRRTEWGRWGSNLRPYMEHIKGQTETKSNALHFYAVGFISCPLVWQCIISQCLSTFLSTVLFVSPHPFQHVDLAESADSSIFQYDKKKDNDTEQIHIHICPNMSFTSNLYNLICFFTWPINTQQKLA